MPETDTIATPTDTDTAPTKGRAYSPQTISALFTKADLAVDGTRSNPEIQTALTAAYNITSADIDALDALTTSTKTHHPVPRRAAW